MKNFKEVIFKLKQIENMNLLLKNDLRYDKYTTTCDYDQALDYAFDFDNWVNLKQRALDDSINMSSNPRKRLGELKDGFDKIKCSVEDSLKQAYIHFDCEQLFEEIVEDITLCLQSVYVSKKRKISKFFQDMFDAYLSGLWPCGYDGVYPNGKLIVYQNNDK